MYPILSFQRFLLINKKTCHQGVGPFGTRLRLVGLTNSATYQAELTRSNIWSLTRVLLPLSNNFLGASSGIKNQEGYNILLQKI